MIFTNMRLTIFSKMLRFWSLQRSVLSLGWLLTVVLQLAVFVLVVCADFFSLRFVQILWYVIQMLYFCCFLQGLGFQTWLGFNRSFMWYKQPVADIRTGWCMHRYVAYEVLAGCILQLPTLYVADLCCYVVMQPILPTKRAVC